MPGKLSWDVESVSKLRVSCADSPMDWLLNESGDVADLVLGETWRSKFREAVNALSNSEGDFNIGPKDVNQGIRFWRWGS